MAFANQVAAARLAQAAEEVAGAAGFLEAALGRWQGGGALAGLAGLWAETERGRLEEARAAAAEELAELRLELGGHAEMIAELNGLVSRYPLREGLRCLLMLALYRSGRQGEALQVYHDTRRLLNAELGIEPGPRLRRLHEQILAGDPVLDQPAVTGQPTRVVPRQLPADASEGSAPSLPRGSGWPLPVRTAGQSGPGGMAAAPTRFVGRGAEVAEVGALLEKCRLVTVTGPGGVGKTRLAGEVARRVGGWFGEGVWLVELAGVGEPSQVAAAVIAALDLRAERGVPLLEWLVRALSRRQLLLVLDNCEHVLPAVARLCAELLRSADDVRVLATSREPLWGCG